LSMSLCVGICLCVCVHFLFLLWLFSFRRLYPPRKKSLIHWIRVWGLLWTQWSFPTMFAIEQSQNRKKKILDWNNYVMKIVWRFENNKG
jgi:hypothetical protein